MTDVRDGPPKIIAAKIIAAEIVEGSVQPGEPEAGTPASALVARTSSPVRRSERALAPDTSVFDLRGRERIAIAPRRRGAGLIALSLIAIVVLPTIASGVYLFRFASDQYVAETRFAVRKSDAPKASDGVEAPNSGGSVATTSLLSGGVNLAGEDAEIVASYIHSRAAVDDVARMVDVRAIFQRPEADFWARLPANAPAEELVRYWNRMVSVYVESSSGIVIVSASAFRRDDALALSRAILTSAESLANSLTVKMRSDQTKLAEDEVRRSEAGVRSALSDLTAFRNTQKVIDPLESSQSTGKLLLQLMSDKISTEGQLFVAQRAQGPDAPGIAGVKARLESINRHIADLQNQLAGNKETSRNMAATLSRFEELEIAKEFAEKMFDFSRLGLERAQLNAMTQSIYLAVFMPPAMPQDFTYPERLTDFFLIALAAVMTWVSGATITASILDHRL